MLKAAQGCVVNIGGGAARSPGADFSIGASVNCRRWGIFKSALPTWQARMALMVNVIHPWRDRDERFYQLFRTARAGIWQIDRTVETRGNGQGWSASAWQAHGHFGSGVVSLFRESAPHSGHRDRRSMGVRPSGTIERTSIEHTHSTIIKYRQSLGLHAQIRLYIYEITVGKGSAMKIDVTRPDRVEHGG